MLHMLDPFTGSCTHECMKTITLDDAAYERLKRWKQSPKESFSQVVKRVVPPAGSLASFLRFAEDEGTDMLKNNDVMERAIDERPDAKPDPWTM